MEETIIAEYLAFLSSKTYPCAGAKAAISKQQIRGLVVRNMDNADSDHIILQFLYRFISEYREAGNLYHSAAVIFQQPLFSSEEAFDTLMWRRLQALHDMDATQYGHDRRVDADPRSPGFSYSLKEEALFIIGMHPSSSRLSRRFKYSVLAFNPHEQFEQLRALNKYALLKSSIRKHDTDYSGSVNPMLDDFGNSSEVRQYSGKQYDESWRCPLIIRYGKTEHYSSA